MVIVRLLGGLGNQFFQYAAGRALASQRQVPLKLDISLFYRYPDRAYTLHHYNILAELATPGAVGRLTGKGRNRIFWRLFTLWQKRLPYYRRTVFKQQADGYDANFWQAPDNIYLAGYWQSEKYFEHIAETIRYELTVKEPPDKENHALCRRILETESVSLHIRRGDYVTNPIVKEYHGICSLDYYETAVATITQTIKQPHFFIFSDDIPWARQNLKLNYATTFVDHNNNAQDYEDMRLMRHCKHHIIANSSFSWWGAWLSDYPQKIVVAPRQWFNNSHDTNDLIPESWIRI